MNWAGEGYCSPEGLAVEQQPTLRRTRSSSWTFSSVPANLEYTTRSPFCKTCRLGVAV